MADIFEPQKRSEVMSRIRSTGTGPENRLYQLVSQLLREDTLLERNVRNMPGQPDILIPDLKLVLFADGCFYHGCPQHGHIPKTNVDYWGPKLARTRLRDSRNRRALRTFGYGVWAIWEHDLRASRMSALAERLERRLRARSLACRIDVVRILAD